MMSFIGFQLADLHCCHVSIFFFYQIYNRLFRSGSDLFFYDRSSASERVFSNHPLYKMHLQFMANALLGIFPPNCFSCCSVSFPYKNSLFILTPTVRYVLSTHSSWLSITRIHGQVRALRKQPMRTVKVFSKIRYSLSN